jgi:hypothetical protein
VGLYAPLHCERFETFSDSCRVSSSESGVPRLGHTSRYNLRKREQRRACLRDLFRAGLVLCNLMKEWHLLIQRANHNR